MLIHKTHSKKNLRELFSHLGYTFNCNLNKNELSKKIHEVVNKDAIKYPNNNDYDIYNKADLENYLKKPNNDEKISLDRKNEVMKKAKKIIQFCKNDYSLKDSLYKDTNQIYADVIFISPYGFLPTIRRACNLYNKYPDKVDRVNAIIPKRIERELEMKKLVKKTQMYNLTIKQGPFLVSFD